MSIWIVAIIAIVLIIIIVIIFRTSKLTTNTDKYQSKMFYNTLNTIIKNQWERDNWDRPNGMPKQTKLGLDMLSA